MLRKIANTTLQDRSIAAGTPAGAFVASLLVAGSTVAALFSGTALRATTKESFMSSFSSSITSSFSPVSLSLPSSHSPASAIVLPQTFLGRFLISEIENRIERISGKKLESSMRALKAREIAAAIGEASYAFDVDPFLLLSMIEVESRYDHMAVGTVGELGLMQIKPTTARWIVPSTDELHGCNLHGIRCNVMTGAAYVSHLKIRTEKRRLNDDSGSLASTRAFREYVLRSYNLGPARTDRLASEDRFASDREPATEVSPEASTVKVRTSYSTKISRRASAFKSRYLVAAAPAAKTKDRNNIAVRVPQTASAVAMIQ